MKVRNVEPEDSSLILMARQADDLRKRWDGAKVISHSEIYAQALPALTTG
jgi:hypothetical protein